MIRWGVLGTANIATERTIPAMIEAASAMPVGLASRDLARARRHAQRFGMKAYGSYGDLLADPEIDAVYVPLPNDLHAAHSQMALEAGKHVLCEKPLGLNSREVRDLITTRDRVGKMIEEALVFRNHPQWEAITEILAKGEIGQPLAVQGTIAKQFLDPADIRNDAARGGGATYDLGPYVIGACNLVFGRAPLRVLATLDFDPDFGIDRLASVLLDYGDAHANLVASSQGGPAAWATHQQLSVLGSKGWLRANFPFAQARPTPCSIELGDETSVGAWPTRTFHFSPVNQYTLQIERLSQVISADSSKSWPIEGALLAMIIIEAMHTSARLSAWVPI